MSLAQRLIRNPRKYRSKAFWSSVVRPVRARAQAESLYAVPFLRSVARHGLRRIAFFPSPIDAFLAQEIYLAWKVLRMCGAVAVTEVERAPNLAIAWHPSTQYSLQPSALAAMRSQCRVVNAACTDIRKSKVDREFFEVFGYGLPVDPLTHQGLLLRKSERNGPHDAVILQGPLQKVEPGYVYQRVVSRRTPAGFEEWRVVVVDTRVVSAYVNYRPEENRFQPLASHSEYCSVSDAFTVSERERIGEFAGRMGLDFGALDVLRDTDGRIYICDCNNTPTGPSSKLSKSLQLRCSYEIAAAFERAYF